MTNKVSRVTIGDFDEQIREMCACKTSVRSMLLIIGCSGVTLKDRMIDLGLAKASDLDLDRRGKRLPSCQEEKSFRSDYTPKNKISKEKQSPRVISEKPRPLTFYERDVRLRAAASRKGSL